MSTTATNPMGASDMNQAKAIKVCATLYAVLSPLHFYPALTGGCLYKEGERKDCDIVIFRNRQAHAQFELRDLEQVLRLAGFTDFRHYGFVTKCMYLGIAIDLFNPETASGDAYDEGGF